MDYGERCLTPTLQRLCTSQQNSDFFCVPHFLPFLAISGDFWRFLGNFPRCVWSGRANSMEFDRIRLKTSLKHCKLAWNRSYCMFCVCSHLTIKLYSSAGRSHCTVNTVCVFLLGLVSFFFPILAEFGKSQRSTWSLDFFFRHQTTLFLFPEKALTFVPPSSSLTV